MSDDPRETRDDLSMMQRPDLWPQGHVLPLKRRHRGGWQTGVLGYYDDGIYLWWDNAILMDNLPLGDAMRISKDSGLAWLIEQGWVVD